jgi:hypothetical protein
MAHRVAEGGRALNATADDRLAALRFATDAELRQELLAKLLTVDAPPVIEAILQRKRSTVDRADRDDLRAQALVLLLRRLARTSELEKPIESFDDYVATVTYHVVDDYVRARNPQGAFAANRIRYVLRHDRRFATWESAGETVCGLAEWKGRPATPFEPRAGRPHVIDAPLLMRLFSESGGPLHLRVLIGHLIDHAPGLRAVESMEDAAFEGVAVRQLLAKLWGEIVELPKPQRLALLLNLRDGPASGALPEFPAAGVASLDAIAAALEWDAGELASRWQELPFDDDRIAALLGITRQQVINLRKAARARLARRLARMNA